jgi:hemolysin III
MGKETSNTLQTEELRAKEERKKRIRKLNEPPKLSLLEEVGNSITHGIGAGLAIAGMILLLVKSDTGLKVMAALFYGISLFLMMLMSCLYHAFKGGSTVKYVFRRFDYSSIYLLIGGTFAPFYLVYLGNVLGIVLFCVQWALIVFGITMVGVFGPGRWRPLHYTLYFVIGWSGLMFLPMWYRNDPPLMWLVLIGGAIYTIGMVPFTMRVKCSHFIWHWFVIFGAILHWFGIFLYVY